MTSNEFASKAGVYALKKRLREYRDTEVYLWEQVERYEYIETKMMSVGSPVLSDMPKAPSPSNDRFAKYAAQLDEIEGEISRIREHQEEEKEWVISILKHIKPSERSVILIRYIDGEDWTKVSEIMFGDREDYEERKDSYLRLTTRRHGRALEDMAAYINGKEYEDKSDSSPNSPQKLLSGLMDKIPIEA